MSEYLIKAQDGEVLVPEGDLAMALLPSGYLCEAVEGWGDYRMRCGSAEVSFSFEDPGIQIDIQGAGDASEAIAEAIRDQLSQTTHRALCIVPL